MLSRVRLCTTSWTVAHQASLSMGILQARILEWVSISYYRGSSQPKDQTHISRINRWMFNCSATGKPCIWKAEIINHVVSNKDKERVIATYIFSFTWLVNFQITLSSNNWSYSLGVQKLFDLFIKFLLHIDLQSKLATYSFNFLFFFLCAPYIIHWFFYLLLFSTKSVVFFNKLSKKTLNPLHFSF